MQQDNPHSHLYRATTRWPAHDSYRPLHLLVGIGSPLEEMQLVNLFAKTHHSVHFVDSHDMALSAFRATKFDAVILSYTLGDGITAPLVTNSLRARAPLCAHIPVICLLPQPDTRLYTQCINAGISSFLCPPLTQDKILNLLDFYGQAE